MLEKNYSNIAVLFWSKHPKKYFWIDVGPTESNLIWIAVHKATVMKLAVIEFGADEQTVLKIAMLKFNTPNLSL